MKIIKVWGIVASYQGTEGWYHPNHVVATFDSKKLARDYFKTRGFDKQRVNAHPKFSIEKCDWIHNPI